MRLGVFSVSLAVKDIKASRAFYEKLDFKEVAGKLEQNWLILQNGTTTIGLFQGMFEKNIMTFNPGWTTDQETLEEFQDVRELQRILKQRGLKLRTEVDESGTGQASFIVIDRSPAVACDAPGRAWVVWQSHGQDGHAGSIITRRFDRSGRSEIIVNQQSHTHATAHETMPVVAAAPDGRALIAWPTATPATPPQLRARLMGADAASNRLGEPVDGMAMWANHEYAENNSWRTWVEGFTPVFDPAELDFDGPVGIRDFLILLGNWG